MKRISATILLSLGLIFGSIIALAGPAGAQTTSHPDCYPGAHHPSSGFCTASVKHFAVPDGPSTVKHATVPTTAPPATPVLVDSQPVASSSLAFTGIDVAGVAGAGVVLVGGGLVLVRVTRRRRVS
jgi:hypothetical protein